MPAFADGHRWISRLRVAQQEMGTDGLQDEHGWN